MKCTKCGSDMETGMFLLKYGCLAFEGWICSCGHGHHEDGAYAGEIWQDLRNYGTGTRVDPSEVQSWLRSTSDEDEW